MTTGLLYVALLLLDPHVHCLLHCFISMYDLPVIPIKDLDFGLLFFLLLSCIWFLFLLNLLQSHLSNNLWSDENVLMFGLLIFNLKDTE